MAEDGRGWKRKKEEAGGWKEEAGGGRRKQGRQRKIGKRGWLCALGAEHVAERKMGNFGSYLLWIGLPLDKTSFG